MTAVKEEDTCQRFNRFLRQAKPGSHFFRGDLHECYTEGKVDTRGRLVTAAEIGCTWPHLENRVTIRDRGIIDWFAKPARDFDLDERCF